MPPKKRKILETVEKKVAEPDSKKPKEMDSSDLNLDDFLEENDPTADKFIQIANSPVSFNFNRLNLGIKISITIFLYNSSGFHTKCLKS